jgi:NAD(P)-dependent dehydrogenase (short-subunit alcohol dehydrogenase family)
MRVAGKKTIITAAASGMGKAGVELFTTEGAKVAAVDRDADALAALEAELTAQGREVKGFVADLSDPEQVHRVYDEAVQWLGGLDVLWSHAGMPAPADVEDFDLEKYRLANEVNVVQSTLLASRAVADLKGKGGSVVFTSSSSGLVGSAQSPFYSAFKSSLIGLTKGLAVRYADQGVRINAICPSMVATPMLYNDFMTSDDRFTAEETEKRFLAAVPMGRPAQPVEIAHAALWLASDDSSFVTGVALPVDGGLTAR